MLRTCEQCESEFEARTVDVRRGFAKFCSIRCSADRRKQMPRKQNEPNSICAVCDTPFFRQQSKLSNAKHGIRFCSRACKDRGQSLAGGVKAIMPSHYGRANGMYTYRNYISTDRCNRCGFSDRRAIVVHHKDRNRRNNKPENLEALCCNCHSIEHS